LYSHKGETRELPFNLDGLSIITGAKGTGKSSIIDIIDYCMGSKTCSVAEGIRQAVSWFAVCLQLKNKQLFIARRSPSAGRGEFYRTIGNTVRVPAFRSLVPNVEHDGIRRELNSELGISPNVFVPMEDSSRLPLMANVRHALRFAFQPQENLLNRRWLFRGIEDRDKRQATKDTLPYLLGAVTEDSLALRYRLQNTRRQLAFAQRQLAEAQALSAGPSANAIGLIQEARQVGLLSDAPPSGGGAEFIDLLRNTVARWSPNLENDDAGSDVQAELERSRRELTMQYRAIKSRIQEARSYALTRNRYLDENYEQHARLRAIDLFGEVDNQLHRCPLCSAESESMSEQVVAIREALQSLSSEMSNLTEGTPNLEEYIQKMQSELEDIRQQLTTNRHALESLIRVDEERSKLISMDYSRAMTIGRISLFLQNYQPVEAIGPLQSQIEALRAQIAAYQEQLSDDKVEERVLSICNRISSSIQKWAHELDLGYSQFPLRFDAKSLTIYSDVESGPVPLQDFGSATNYVGYHLVSHLALHQHFLRNSRPVPRFVVFDQPSSTYFLPEYEEADPDGIERQNVLRMFEWLYTRSTIEFAAGFQIILTEHADLAADWFQAAVVERWRDGKALVPQEWMR
jgi:hypothetical protein